MKNTTKNISLDNKIVNILNNNGFSMDLINNSNLLEKYDVQINQCTPNKMDWWITIYFDGTNQGFIKGVKNRHDEYDIDKQTELLIKKRGKNGIPSSVKTLLEDVEWRKRKLEELYNQLNKLEFINE